MPIYDALLVALLLAGLLGLLESVSRRFWAPLWVARGFSSAWSLHKPTTVRLAAATTAAVLAGVSFESVESAIGFAALTWGAALAISTDMADMKIPSEAVWTVLWIALLAASTESALRGSIAGNANALTDMFLSEAVVVGVVLVTALVTMGGIGSGDVRLIAALTVSTAWLGAGAAIPALALAPIGYLVMRRTTASPPRATGTLARPVPFAPGIVAGYTAVALAVAFTTLLTA